MKSPFNPVTGEWEIGWPGRVSRHDVVYLTPPCDPTQGMPIGNGDVGALAWCDGSRLILAVNKCDLWDDASFGRFHNWAAHEEDVSSALRHACRIIFDFKLPIFDTFYLSDFTARISLADARLSLRAAGPFGAVEIKAFVGHDDGILCCEVNSHLCAGAPAGAPIEVTLERYGSRTFGHWYSLVNRDPSIGLRGTTSSVDQNGAFVRHTLTSGAFAAGCRVTDMEGVPAPAQFERQHDHACIIRGLPCAGTFTLLAVVTSPLDDAPTGGPTAIARSKLDTAQQTGTATLYAQHARAWKDFWQRSLMEGGDDYLDNLWHLTMYYANSSQRGSYPGRFINGLWNWSRDVQNWTFYFHWNQQETYWPLNAAGHHDLVTSYLDYRFRQLPIAKQDARELFNAAGAWVSDVCDRRGYNSLSELGNHTPVAEIALDFWRQYQFTRDRAFLTQRALPYLVEAATFFESLFERGEDGLYHAREGTGYEGWIKLRDALTELVYARTLFTATFQAIDEAANPPEGCRPEPQSTAASLREDGLAQHLSRWREILAHLAPLPVTSPDDCFEETTDGLRLKRGFFKGQPVASRQTLAAGHGIAEGRVLAAKCAAPPAPPIQPDDVYTTLIKLEQNQTPYSALRDDMQYYDGIFPTVEESAIFPSGLIGLADRGADLFEIAISTAKLYAPDCMGWDPLPIVLARLGQGEAMAEILKRFPSRWQFYCNGFGHYGPRDVMKADGALRFRSSMVMDAQLPADERPVRKFPLQMWPFRHMGMESMSVLACALNESLLQSYDGVIRVAPAVTAAQAARFTLHATGGFVISAQVEQGRLQWVHIASRLGGVCAIENPWPIAHLIRAGSPAGSSMDCVIELATQAGERIMLVPAPDTIASWEIAPINPSPNAAPKICPQGIASLGLPRMF